METRMRLLAATLFLALSACAATAPCSGGLRTADRIEMYFGTNLPDGGTVTLDAWQRFSETVLTSAFPSGFTVLDGAGQWRNPRDGIVREPVKVVIVAGATL